MAIVNSYWTGKSSFFNSIYFFHIFERLGLIFVFVDNKYCRWYKAANASDKKSSNKNSRDYRKKNQMTPKQEEVLWRAFISHLRSNVCTYMLLIYIIFVTV